VLNLTSFLIWFLQMTMLGPTETSSDVVHVWLIFLLLPSPWMYASKT